MARRAWAGAIQSPADVRRILADVNATGLERANTTALARVVQPAEEFELAPDTSKLLPAPPDLASLLYLNKRSRRFQDLDASLAPGPRL